MMRYLASTLLPLLAQVGDPDRFRDLSKSFKGIGERSSMSTVWWVAGSLIVISGVAMGQVWWNRRKRFLEKNATFFDVGRRLGLSRSQLRTLVWLGRQLTLDNLVMLYVQKSKWDAYLEKTPPSSVRNEVAALYQIIFK